MELDCLFALHRHTHTHTHTTTTSHSQATLLNVHIYLFFRLVLPECHLLELLGAQGLAELLVEESQLGFLCLRLLQDLLGQSVGLVVHPNR